MITVNRFLPPVIGLLVGLSVLASDAAEAARRPAKRASAVKRSTTKKPTARYRPRLTPAKGAPAYRPVERRTVGVLPDTLPQSLSLEEMEAGVIRGLNRERQARGLAPLRVNESLSSIAREFSRRMATERFFDHVSPRGDSVGKFVERGGIDYRMLGDNLYTCTRMRDPESSAVRGWMESPGHRSNILEPDYRETGLGVWRAGDTYYFTQVFMAPWR